MTWVITFKFVSSPLFETAFGGWRSLAQAMVYETQAAANRAVANRQYCHAIDMEQAQTLVTLAAL